MLEELEKNMEKRTLKREKIEELYTNENWGLENTIPGKTQTAMCFQE